MLDVFTYFLASFSFPRVIILPRVFVLPCVFAFTCVFAYTQDSTYAERLGFPKGAKVVVMHIDDVGMSYDCNAGDHRCTHRSVAKSCSIMMPCPWVSGFFHYLKDHPDTDAGLHLTLTSEWKDYRWGPVSGNRRYPDLWIQRGSCGPMLPMW